MNDTAPPSTLPGLARGSPFASRLPGDSLAVRLAIAAAISIGCAAALVALSGHDPMQAFGAMAAGALGSPHQIGVAVNRATPYLLAGGGVALCFRAGVINIGAEGQIALGGAGAAAVALVWPQAASPFAAAASLLGAAGLGALWSGLAALIHIRRNVHEVLATLLLNFVALLLVQQALAGPLGQAGAGFLQSPELPAAAWLWKAPVWGAHAGILLALAAAGALSLLLWRTPFGFALRILGRSRQAAAYAGVSIPGVTWGVMLIAGALAGLAGGVETLGVHHRLIDGFSTGFGFKAVTVALLGAEEPLALAPAALFMGLIEAGGLSMQRQTGVPSALVVVIEGVAMLCVLAATARRA